jgi:hypothetical protein
MLAGFACSCQLSLVISASLGQHCTLIPGQHCTLFIIPRAALPFLFGELQPHVLTSSCPCGGGPAGRAPFRHLIYPLPEPGTAGLGTHLTLDLGGQAKFGPDVSRPAGEPALWHARRIQQGWTATASWLVNGAAVGTEMPPCAPAPTVWAAAPVVHAAAPAFRALSPCCVWQAASSLLVNTGRVAGGGDSPCGY